MVVSNFLVNSRGCFYVDMCIAAHSFLVEFFNTENHVTAPSNHICYSSAPICCDRIRLVAFLYQLCFWSCKIHSKVREFERPGKTNIKKTYKLCWDALLLSVKISSNLRRDKQCSFEIIDIAMENHLIFAWNCPHLCLVFFCRLRLYRCWYMLG